MRAGSMRIPMRLQNATITKDEFGAAVETWDDPGLAIWVSIENSQSNEQIRAGQIDEIVTHQFRARYHPLIRHGSRLIWEEPGAAARTFNVVAANDFQNRHIFTDILAREVRN